MSNSCAGFDQFQAQLRKFVPFPGTNLFSESGYADSFTIGSY